MRYWLMAACVAALLGSVAVRGGDDLKDLIPPNLTQEGIKIAMELAQLSSDIKSMEKKYGNDPEVVAAKKAFDEAKRNLEATIEAKISNDPEGQRLLQKKKELEEKIAALVKQGKAKKEKAADAANTGKSGTAQ